ncbi:hypothetical protein CSUB01_12281 [Colletotrichum sublineola]|uniref:Uncharacterized protein n=1 Tax=Colletotrichum sublineola TaxID=1173701 RepID=A0A066XBM4_COLSU|nr:hypothetical protein CSUB01_12281 [Colletotrichum sublineola]
MAGFNFVLSIRVVIKMKGQNVVEHDDPDAGNMGLEAPFTFCKLIKIKGGASFSIDILLGGGIRDILTSDDSALMAVVHFGSQEAFGNEEDIEARERTKAPPDSGGDENGNIPKGSIKVNVYMVKLLSKPERGKLVDITDSGPPPQSIIFESDETKSQATDTYDINSLNHGPPLARFIFKYQTKRTPLAGVKPKCNNERTDEDLIDLNDVRSAQNRSPAFGMEQSLPGTPGTTVMPESSLDAPQMNPQVHTAMKLFDGLMLSDSEEEKAEMNRLYLPLQPRGSFAEMGEMNDHAKTENDEAISIQSSHDAKSTVFRKRKAGAAFDESSPPRPRKAIALRE